MSGLIYHELGHVYHKQFGRFQQHSDSDGRNFVWQLFAEGIAMYFEQVLVLDILYCSGILDKIRAKKNAIFKKEK